MSAQPALLEPVDPTAAEKPTLLVTEIVSSREAHVTWAVDVGFTGMTLRRTPADMRGWRFLWIEFELPNEVRSFRALVEVIEMTDDTRVVRFKHLWPRERALYEQYVAELLGFDSQSETEALSLDPEYVSVGFHVLIF